jgi:hypothetical protein
MLKKVLGVGIETADGPQQLRYLIYKLVRLEWAPSNIDNLGKELSDIVNALCVRLW